MLHATKMFDIGRVSRYVRAVTGLGEFNRQTASLAEHPPELIACRFNYSNGFLKPFQLQEELACLLEDVRRLDPQTVVEIGTAAGGTLYLWTRLARADALIVSIDLPGGQFGGGYIPLRTPLYRRFARERQTLHLIRADSHAISTRERLTNLLNGPAIDFLFIDADHTYEGIKRDWEMYSPLVRRGGVIAVHDIAANYETFEVKKFWDEIKSGFSWKEYAVDPKGRYGIGVLFK
jgi:predicted O-methyltransferase YrrM